MENLQGGTLALEHRYFVEQRLGQYGFMVLYRGTQEPFGHPVWITTFDPLLEAGADKHLFERIKTSVQHISSLRVSGALRVLDFGELDYGIPFVVSERVESATLTDFLADERTISPEQTAKLIARLSEILACVHRAKVSHGNLLPQFIYIPNNELSQAVIGHFQLGLSLAEILQMPQAIPSPEAVMHLAPEAFLTDPQPDPTTGLATYDPLADVYALGSIAYCALVGMHPFFDDPLDASEGMLRIKNEQPQLLSDLGIEQALSTVIHRALAKDPQQRWQSVQAFSDALLEAIHPAAMVDPLERELVQDSKSTDNHALDNETPTSAAVQTAESLQPNGTLLTLALALLILSNLAWFFFLVWQNDLSGTEPDTADPSSAITGMQVLPD